MNQFIFFIAILLLSTFLVQTAIPQDAVSGVFAPLELRPDDDINMVVIPAGSFTMGSEKYRDERPLHMVYIRSFLMGKTEVTQKQWQDVMGRNGGQFAGCGDDCPVEMVSWEDAQEFIAKLNQSTGQKYRLPSEAEWEYSARAATTTEWSFGNDESKLGKFAWYDRNSLGKTQGVGQKLPNAFGLFDMHGNVWEWTQDCWHENYAMAPSDGKAWATDCSGNFRVLRGGSFTSISENLRSAYRGGDYQASRRSFYGFRLAKNLPLP